MKKILHRKGHLESFTELHGEEKREEGNRGEQEEKRKNQKGRKQSSQQTIPYVFSTTWNPPRDSQSSVEKRRRRKNIEVNRRRKWGIKRRKTDLGSNQFRK